jgi:hypothetical protein
MEEVFDRPICDGAGEDVAPESLRPTFEHATFSHKFAGEWQMQFPPTYAGARATDDWLRVQLGDFLAAFPWLKIESIEVATPDQSFGWQDDKGLSLSAWLDTLGSEVRRSYGYEAKLAACCFWADAEGRVGRCTLPGAADLDYDQTSRLLNLYFWPNVFTDVIDVYQADWRTRPHEGEPASFRPAAARNREQLAASLHAIAAKTGAQLTSAGSDKLKGIVPFGFAEDASTL